MHARIRSPDWHPLRTCSVVSTVSSSFAFVTNACSTLWYALILAMTVWVGGGWMGAGQRVCGVGVSVEECGAGGGEGGHKRRECAQKETEESTT
jgi:hypothetical protein